MDGLAGDAVDDRDGDPVGADILDPRDDPVAQALGPSDHEHPLQCLVTEGGDLVQVEEGTASLGACGAVDSLPGLVDGVLDPPVVAGHDLQRRERVGQYQLEPAGLNPRDQLEVGVEKGDPPLVAGLLAVVFCLLPLPLPLNIFG